MVIRTFDVTDEERPPMQRFRSTTVPDSVWQPLRDSEPGTAGRMKEGCTKCLIRFPGLCWWEQRNRILKNSVLPQL